MNHLDEAGIAGACFALAAGLVLLKLLILWLGIPL